MTVHSPNILHVVCEGDRTRLMPARLLGFEVQTSSIAEKIPTAAKTIVFDIDLGDAHNIAKLAAFRKTAPATCKQIFAIGKGNLQEELQATTLGARQTITKPLCENGLARIIEGLRDAAGITTPTASKAVNAAARTLEHSFARFRAKQPVDLAEVSATGAEIAKSIGNVGIAEWLSTVRAYHQTTFQHILIVTGLACSFATSLGMRKADIDKLTIAGLLHDIGKVDIPAAILDKPGKLNPDELEIIRTHPRSGHQVLSRQRDLGDDVLDAILHHHEFLDGSGYPDGLAGDQIPDLTRILTICDIMGALLERRAYKEPFSVEQSVSILMNMASAGKIEAVLVHALARTLENKASGTIPLPDQDEIDMAPLYLSANEVG
ncbi:MAG: HD domain-containing phosphohydrolase [Pseudomonadota bacterium]